jgi:hypothetical protein
MNRRAALKGFALTGIAAVLLPGCLGDSQKKVSIALNNLDITAGDESLIEAFAETLLPGSTDNPGAKETGAHLFALVMVDDCLPEDKKDLFIRGLREFNKNSHVPNKKEFMDVSPAEKLQTLESIEKGREFLDEPLKTFYFTAKRYIIQGYTTSKFFMTEVKPYKLVPGPIYKGCVPLSTT